MRLMIIMFLAVGSMAMFNPFGQQNIPEAQKKNVEKEIQWLAGVYNQFAADCGHPDTTCSKTKAKMQLSGIIEAAEKIMAMKYKNQIIMKEPKEWNIATTFFTMNMTDFKSMLQSRLASLDNTSARLCWNSTFYVEERYLGGEWKRFAVSTGRKRQVRECNATSFMDNLINVETDSHFKQYSNELRQKCPTGNLRAQKWMTKGKWQGKYPWRVATVICEEFKGTGKSVNGPQINLK